MIAFAEAFAHLGGALKYFENRQSGKLLLDLSQGRVDTPTLHLRTISAVLVTG